MKILLIALRNLTRQKRRSILLGGAIAFGFFFVTLINSFAGSFIINVSENASQLMAGHIFINGFFKNQEEGRTYQVVKDPQLLEKTIKEIDIDYKLLSRRSTFQGSLIFEGNRVNQAVIGADWQEEAFFKQRVPVLKGDFDFHGRRQGIVLTKGIAEKLKADINDRITVKLRTFSGQFNAGEFELIAISQDSGLAGARTAYADLSYVNELLNLEQDNYMTLGIYLQQLDQMQPAAARLYNALEDKVSLFDREKAQEEANPLRAMMQQRRDQDWKGTRYALSTLDDGLKQFREIIFILDIASLVLLIVLFFIIMVGIANTFRMVLYERTREIGTMRAMGMQRGRVRLLFLLEAFFLALMGILAGLMLSGMTMFILMQIDLGMNTPLFIVLKNGHFTFYIPPLRMLLNSGLIIFLTLAAAFFPANEAAALQPASALRKAV